MSPFNTSQLKPRAPPTPRKQDTAPTSSSEFRISTPETKSPASSGPTGQEPDASGVGLSDAQISKSRRQMLDLVNRLQSTGVQVDIDLPQIAVIGSQSAGKSSLIEAISGITLPRAAGTCTRCPTECRLSGSASAWKCEVSLRFIVDQSGQPLGQARNQKFGPTIFKKEEVEDRIKRAQNAILNPSLSPNKFLVGDADSLPPSELTFSRNVVSLSISGPGVADLSFCDLPGLIASVGSGRGGAGDIALVENLIKSYITKPSCIILLTVACETDFENQGAHQLAKIHDPEGKRTIGVLTKPDRIPSGDESGWLRFIKNEREPLEHNWYCVKQPSSADLAQGMTWAKARQREDEFFTSTEPWSELDPMWHRYLRTRNLVGRLSSVLSELITKRLPEIQDELAKGINATRNALNDLPQAPSADPLSDIASLLHVFTAEIQTHVKGIARKKGLLQTIGPVQQKFRRAIRETAPAFVPCSRQQFSSQSVPRIKFLENEEETDDQLTAGAKGKAPKKFIYLDEVHALAEEARTRELPGYYPFVVQETFISEIVGQWREPSLAYLKSVQEILVAYMNNLVTERFKYFGQGLLEQRIRAIILAHLQDCFQAAETRIKWLLDVEVLPFTLNQHYLTDYRSKFLQAYQEARPDADRQRISAHIAEHKAAGVSQKADGAEPTTVTRAMAVLAEMGITVRPEDLFNLLPNDEMAPAIGIMADVRAYFQVAYKRFADMIPLAVDHEVVLGVGRNVLELMNRGLGILGPEGHRLAKELASESPQLADRREELMKKLERLQIAKQELLELGM